MIGLSGTATLLLSVLGGFLLTSLAWIRLGPALRRSHEKVQSVYERTDDAGRKRMAAIEGSPERKTRPGAMVLQFALILAPVTMVIHYLLTKVL